MDKELFNVLAKFKEMIKNDKKLADEEVLYSYDKTFDIYEQGKLLSAIVKQYPEDMEDLDNIRCMIDYKFEMET